MKENESEERFTCVDFFYSLPLIPDFAMAFKAWMVVRALIFVSSFILVAGVLLILVGTRYSMFVSEDHMSTHEATALIIIGSVLCLVGLFGWLYGVWKELLQESASLETSRELCKDEIPTITISSAH